VISEPPSVHERRAAELERKLLRLENKLHAKEKTIRTLIQRLEERQESRSSSFHILEHNAAIERMVSTKTNSLEDQKQRLSEALQELKRTQAKLLQAQKLEAIGQLAAGIAHEINTPTQYVSDNTAFLQRAFGSLMSALDTLQQVLAAARSGAVPPEAIEAADEVLSRAKLPYLLKHIPRAVEQSLEGLGRISSIVLAMKEFSHPSGNEKQPVNLHEAIESTVTIARNEWKYVADMEFDFDDTLPLVPVHRNEFNQVVLNVIVNAAHAIAEASDNGAKGKGKIRIRTRRDDDFVEIRVIDSGNGIPEKIRGRVFEPFFTTKPVGRGTGQGLAISYSVIVDKHRGTIAFETEEGRGTTFVIRLPLMSSAAPESAADGCA
jgi:two-component system, NtrC family, sensor kinase